VEFFASTLDAFLQDFVEKANSDDRLGALVACSRLAQLGSVIRDEYMENVYSLAESATEMRVAQQAAHLVVEMVNRNGEQCGLAKEDVPATTPTPDRSLS
jgi:hypothetical protein